MIVSMLKTDNCERGAKNNINVLCGHTVNKIYMYCTCDTMKACKRLLFNVYTAYIMSNIDELYVKVKQL